MLLGAVIWGGVGCGAAPETTIDGKVTLQAESNSLTVSSDWIGEWTDWSGTVHVTLWAAPWTQAQNPLSDCDVGGDEVLVGGGAEVWGSYPEGGLLTESYPLNKQTWRARSKDHEYVYSHWLRSYCIGLRLDGVSKANLEAETTIHSAGPWWYNQQYAFVQVTGANRLLTGGGGRGEYTGAGVLLTQSDGATGSGSWSVHVKDHSYVDSSGKAHAYAISIPSQPTGYSGTLTNTTVTAGNSSEAGTGYRMKAADANSGWAMTGVGGYSSYPWIGRLLTDITPNIGWYGNGGVHVYSKDHSYSESGYVIASVYAIKKL
jgi:hypothetical protein